MEISKLSKLITPSGTMAISNKARILREQGKPVIGFGAGEPDFPTPEYVSKRRSSSCRRYQLITNTLQLLG